MNKILAIIACVIMFVTGFITARHFYRKERIVEKQIKVYDFSQDERMMKVYANTLGYELIDKETNGAYKHGFEDGYGQGRGRRD